jgi:hypothetical protein
VERFKEEQMGAVDDAHFVWLLMAFTVSSCVLLCWKRGKTRPISGSCCSEDVGVGLPGC